MVLRSTRKITPKAIQNLAEFVHATGWKLIYGLNMGTEDAETAAAEAAYVTHAIGDRLIAFQLCNEPDLFSRNGLRKPDYNYAQFAREWQHFYEVIRQKVPNAPFAGPDTAFNNEWLVPFAKQFQARSGVSLAALLCGGSADRSLHDHRAPAAAESKARGGVPGHGGTKAESNLPFRLAETNSCYQGGKQGVSNTFASALWGADLMYQLASCRRSGHQLSRGRLRLVHAHRRNRAERLPRSPHLLRDAALRRGRYRASDRRAH